MAAVNSAMESGRLYPISCHTAWKLSSILYRICDPFFRRREHRRSPSLWLPRLCLHSVNDACWDRISKASRSFELHPSSLSSKSKNCSRGYMGSIFGSRIVFPSHLLLFLDICFLSFVRSHSHFNFLFFINVSCWKNFQGQAQLWFSFALFLFFLLCYCILLPAACCLFFAVFLFFAAHSLQEFHRSDHLSSFTFFFFSSFILSQHSKPISVPDSLARPLPFPFFFLNPFFMHPAPSCCCSCDIHIHTEIILSSLTVYSLQAFPNSFLFFCVPPSWLSSGFFVFAQFYRSTTPFVGSSISWSLRSVGRSIKLPVLIVHTFRDDRIDSQLILRMANQLKCSSMSSIILVHVFLW